MELNEAFQGADSIIGILGRELPATMGASLFDCLFPHLLTIDIGTLSINKKPIGYPLYPWSWLRGHGEAPGAKEKASGGGIRLPIEMLPLQGNPFQTFSQLAAKLA